MELKREAYRVAIDDHLLTFMKSCSGGAEPDDVVVIYEDAYGETTVSVKKMQEIIDAHCSLVDLGKSYKEAYYKIVEIKELFKIK